MDKYRRELLSISFNMDLKNYFWLNIILGFVCISKAALTIEESSSPLPPHIIVQPPNDEILFRVQPRGSEISIPFILGCEAEGDPKPQFKWIKNGRDFNKNEYDDGRISQNSGRGTLNFTRPLDKDVGQYQCFAYNKYGTAMSNSVFVRKATFLSFKEEEPVTIYADEGKPFNLTCNPPASWPKPLVLWMHQVKGGPLKNFNSSRLTVDPEGTLWFSNVTKADESTEFYYACVAYTQIQKEYQVGSRFYLRVSPMRGLPSQNKYSLTSQYASNRSIAVAQGNEVNLWCIIGGTPIPEIKWGKIGDELPRDRIEYGEYGKTLKITDVDFGDEGTYFCNATNGIDTSISHSFNVSVYAAPYFTVEPQNANVIKGETAEFRCEVKGEPDPKIKWIQNGKPLEEAAINPRRKLIENKIVIENVIPSDIGNYGCNATNIFGYIYKDVYINVYTHAQTKGSKQSYVAGGKDSQFRNKMNKFVPFLVLILNFRL